MAAIQLSVGQLPVLASDSPSKNDLKPIVQVLDVKIVASQRGGEGKERYRLLLSDGEVYIQGMLATQNNDLVRSERLKNGSVIRLTQFTSNLIQGRWIVIILDLDVIHETCGVIGEPTQYQLKTASMTAELTGSIAQRQSSLNQPGQVGCPQSFGGYSASDGPISKPLISRGTHMQPPETGRSAGSFNPDSGQNTPANVPPKTEYGRGTPSVPLTSNVVRPAYSPSLVHLNRGPVGRNEPAQRIIPIAALNVYSNEWTIKARVTAMTELREYHNQNGQGKVFSFDLLDSDCGEIRVTCFKDQAEQFHKQVEVGKVYLISKGSVKPAKRNFNHLHNDHEITLGPRSTVQPCFDDDSSIPKQQFHFCSISQIEGMENNTVVDVVGVVFSVSPSTSLMRKDNTGTLRRSLRLKDMSGRSVELTLWGNFCNAEGQELQNKCDAGLFPVLAVKLGRVNDFNGKAVGTISTSQLFIEPDIPEAHKLKAWFEKEGKDIPTVSLSRETYGRKTIAQIKDEMLGTNGPDWITVKATIIFIKTENFFYRACPLKNGQCNKKVTDNGDGKWMCSSCNVELENCDYRYILSFQIQDHTGSIWVTAFQESGQEVMGVSAKDLYQCKYEQQDDEEFGHIVKEALFKKYIFKLKVKEETYNDESRVKSTVVKAEKTNFSLESRFLLDLVDKRLENDLSFPRPENVISSSGLNKTGLGNVGHIDRAPPVANYAGSSRTAVSHETGVPANQVSQYGNQYSGSRLNVTASMSCNGCGGTGHISTNCPSIMNDQGHLARDCPGVSNNPLYRSGNHTPGGYGNVPKQHVGGGF